jgi:Flp pilus assembly protein TadG
MIPRILARFSSDERGAVLVLVALGSVVLVGVAALAIDLGMLYTARSEAQRAADAAALAGAQEFLYSAPEVAELPARDSAISFAQRNQIQKVAIDPSEVMVEVRRDQRIVQVEVARKVETLFARVLGFREVTVSALAQARASAASTARCVAPFAVPDLWKNNHPKYNGDQVPVWGDTTWRYVPGRDDYKRHDGNFGDCPPNDDGTGYGSCLRGPGRDFGRQIKIKVTDPNDPGQAVSGFFFPIQLGDNKGAKEYENSIAECDPTVVTIGAEMRVENGNMVGPTYDGLQRLVKKDPNARWDPTADNGRGAVVGSNSANWYDSPRVVAIVLYDPGSIRNPSDKFFTVNNVALMFIEEQQDKKDPIVARFLYFAQGGASGGGNAGSLVFTLQLIK